MRLASAAAFKYSLRVSLLVIACTLVSQGGVAASPQAPGAGQRKTRQKALKSEAILMVSLSCLQPVL